MNKVSRINTSKPQVASGKARRRKKVTNKRVPYSVISRQVVADATFAANVVRRYINTELHYIDTVAAGTQVSTTATFILLNGVTQGDTVITRSGSSIKCCGGQLSWDATINALAVTTLLRILVVVDHQPNNAIFAIGSLLNATTTRSPYVPEFEKRFLIVKDEVFAFALNGPQVITSAFKINFNAHVNYSATGNAGTVADIDTNSLYMVLISDQASNTIGFSYYSRLWFVDN